MPVVINGQFVDATDADGSTVLIEEGDAESLGRFAWTILKAESGA